MKNNQKGITLIALVVTIIVLLILAGVSIAMITGQSGILGQARTAAWQTKLGEAQSTVALKVSEYWTDYMSNAYSGTTAKYYGGSNTNIGTQVTNGWTTENDITQKACAAAETELGGSTAGFAVTCDPVGSGTVKSITITYTVKGVPYSVTGKIETGATTPTWGKMTDPTASK